MTTLTVCECCSTVAENGGADGTAHGIDMCGTTHLRAENVGAIPFGMSFRDSLDNYGPPSECDLCGAELGRGATEYEYSDEAPEMVALDKWDRAEFWEGYRAAILWTATANEPEEFGGGDDSLNSYVEDDDEAWTMVAPASRAGILRDVIAFLARLSEEVNEDEWSAYEAAIGFRGGAAWSHAGHDFALTRNGHGAGFWDRGAGDIGAKLTRMSKDAGGSNVYADLSGPIGDEATRVIGVYVD